jgi:competence protein ComEA
VPEQRWWSSWRQRLDALPVEPSQVAAAAVVVVVVVVAGVGWVVSSLRRPPGPPVEEVLPMAAASSTTVAERVVVHVAGAVARPGVYALARGARVAEAVAAAGGPGTGADLDRVNLAAPVADGERVYVPRQGEPPPEPVPAASRIGATAEGPLDLNTATSEQLEALPGIGPSTARAIVEHRTRRGRFRSVDQLLEVRGIGPAKLDELRTKVRV